MSLVGFKGKNHPQQTETSGQLSMLPEPPSSELTDDRATDPATFALWQERFGFTVDVAASAANAKLPRFYDRETDGLAQSWAGERVWCNPPYSDIGAWVDKAWTEFGGREMGASVTRAMAAELIVLLLPANRPEQPWWQDHVEPYRDRPGSPLSVEFLRGRLRFIKPGNATVGMDERPPFGCCLLIWEAP